MMVLMTTKPLSSDPITKTQARQIANLLARTDRIKSVEIRESITHGTFAVVYHNACWMERRIETWGDFEYARQHETGRRG